jgi:hypothetical protein
MALGLDTDLASLPPNTTRVRFPDDTIIRIGFYDSPRNRNPILVLKAVEQMIKHVVFFKFKPEASPEERREALDELRSLPGKIDVIREFEVGEEILGQLRSWDAVLISTFDDLVGFQSPSRLSTNAL